MLAWGTPIAETAPSPALGARVCLLTSAGARVGQLLRDPRELRYARLDDSLARCAIDGRRCGLSSLEELV